TGGLKSRTSCGDVFGIAESNGLAEGIRFKGRRPQGRLTTRSLATPVLVLLGHESSALHRGLIIVSSFLGALRQFYLLPGRLAVRNQAQEVRDAVQTGPLLIVGWHDVPWRSLGISRLQHHVASPGIVIPARAGWQIHRAELPLAKRIRDAGLEAPF